MEEHISLAPFTTFKIGGEARYFTRVGDLPALREALAFAKRKNVPVFILGGGSNILVHDRGFPGLVIRIEIEGIAIEEKGEEVFLKAGAGASWDALVCAAVERGYGGIENLSGIPGTVGGAVAGNIGAYGQSVSQTFFSSDVFDTHTGGIKTFGPKDCAFGYRDSVFKHDHKRYIIVSAIFKLSRNPKIDVSYKDFQNYFSAAAPTLRDVRDAVLKIRQGKFPDLSTVGAAGSFFRNPILEPEEAQKLHCAYPEMPLFPLPESSGIKVPAAWFLDKLLHWNGHSRGHFGVYEKQALVPVNYGGATAEEIKKLTDDMAKSVKEKTGIELKREVELVGFEE